MKTAPDKILCNCDGGDGDSYNGGDDVNIYDDKDEDCPQHKDLEKYLIQPVGDYNPDLPMDEQTGCLPYDPKWEFPKERLRLGESYWVFFFSFHMQVC